MTDFLDIDSFRVTDLVSYRYGDERELRGKLARQTAPITTDHRSNSEVLFGQTPKHVKIGGLLHDTFLQFYWKEVELSKLDLGEDLSRDFEDILWDMLEDKDSQSSYLKQNFIELQHGYGVEPESIPNETLQGRRFDDLIRDFADYREENWEEEVEEVMERELDVEAEVEELAGTVDIRGRADMLVETTEGEEVWEVKTRATSEPPLDRHVYQVLLYAYALDAEPVIDYPVTEARVRPDYDPDDLEYKAKDDIYGLADRVELARRCQAEELQRLTGEKMYDYETLEGYRERLDDELGEEEAEEISMEATENALEAAV